MQERGCKWPRSCNIEHALIITHSDHSVAEGGNAHYPFLKVRSIATIHLDGAGCHRRMDQAASQLGTRQSRVSELVRGKCDKFSLDMLLVFASRARLKPGLTLEKAA